MYCIACPLHSIARNVIAEKHHVGFEHASAFRTQRDGERVDDLVLNLCITIRCHGDRTWVTTRQLRVECDKPFLHKRSGESGMATEAGNLVHTAVQFDHGVSAGALMQTIDVLRDDGRHHAARLQRRQSQMPGVGGCIGHGLPAVIASGPITAAGRFAAEEALVLDGRRVPPGTQRIAIGRDAARSAQPGTRQDHVRGGPKTIQLLDRGDLRVRRVADVSRP